MRADRGLTSDSAIAGMQVGGSVGTNSIFLWTPSDPFRTLAALRTGGPNNATYCTDHSGNFLFQSARFGFCSLYNKVKRGFCYTVLASPGCDLFVFICPYSAKETYDTMWDPYHIVSEPNCRQVAGAK